LGKSKREFFSCYEFSKIGWQVKRQIFERDNRIEFEQLKMNAEKLKQLIIAKTLLHLLSLHKHVAQFQTSS
jgi:hypothetical protein